METNEITLKATTKVFGKFFKRGRAGNSVARRDKNYIPKLSANIHTMIYSAGYRSREEEKTGEEGRKR